MHKDRLIVSALLVVLTIAAGSAALAQSTSPNSSPTPSPSPQASTTDQVKDWTQKQWNSMKREWRKDKAKWDTCNRQASDQKLTGKASWTFIYDCMKAS
jgi:serine protease inhibitor ecotin